MATQGSSSAGQPEPGARMGVRGGGGWPCSWPLSLSGYQRGSLPWLPVRACVLLALSLSKWFNFFIPSLIFYCFLWMKREKLVLKNI